MKTISDHILDILQNSIAAEATLIEIIVEENKKNDFYTLEINDNGCGMDEEILGKATDPFYTSRTTRKVGLGLSLFKQNAETANGSLILKSKSGAGTQVRATFRLSNVDCPPLGNIWEILYLTWLSCTNIELKYVHQTQIGQFEIDSNEIKELLGEVPLTNRKIKEAIYELIKNNLKSIQATI